MEFNGYPTVRVAKVKKTGKRVDSPSEEEKTIDREKSIQEKAGQMCLAKE